MFYKILLILAIINLVREFNRDVKEFSVKKAAEGTLSTGSYFKMGLSALFYVMVISVALVPALILL